ncbi:hypothetical protein IMSHALPRED_009367 [Imshaugia aleurites]|uniref:Uncharacterized protein n=1 Tax=Imshaugia aleurites TaxID=172621 RepID=A0A8H3FZD9_9LECA|nr:hypothetical protein IMSHALPRED_009367 [Imshaugia aleurites]
MPDVKAQDWIGRIKKGESDATAALLVTLFSNVKSLTVSTCDDISGSLLFRTLEKMALSVAKHNSRALGAFRELSEIEIRGAKEHTRGPGRYGTYGDGELIAVFMMLPSVRVIKGYRVIWFGSGWPYEPVTSSVKEISLESSQIDSKLMMECLKGSERLERFTYNQDSVLYSVATWEPRLIVKALRKYAGKSLVHLELTGDDSGLPSRPADDEPFIGTLRSFQVLRSIRLMTMMLFKLVDGDDIDEDVDMIQSALKNRGEPHSLVELRRLVDFLPLSAEKLELVGGISDEEAQDIFADLPELKGERVPILGDIVLEDSDPLERDTKDLCKKAGIRLKSTKRVVNRYQRIYAVTKPEPQVLLER